MNVIELLTRERMIAVLDKNFPKGKTKARGGGLMMLAEAVVISNIIVKAFGNCTTCYGKGYATYMEGYSVGGEKWKEDRIRFCSCSRGKDLKKIMKSRYNSKTV